MRLTTHAPRHPDNNDIIHLPRFMPPYQATLLFKVLDEHVTWTTEAERISTGVIQPLNRKMAYMATQVRPYEYAGNRIPGQPRMPKLLDLNDHLCRSLGAELGISDGYFNSVLLNHYADGKDTIDWHADKEPQLGEDPMILMVNLGATRIFKMKQIKADEGQERRKVDVKLENGDVLVMLVGCQKRWLHAIKGEPLVTEPRISLTFRRVIETLS